MKRQTPFYLEVYLADRFVLLILQDEINHVKFLRFALGDYAVSLLHRISPYLLGGILSGT